MAASDSLRERVNPAWSPEVRANISRSLAASDLAYAARAPSGPAPTSERERNADMLHRLDQLSHPAAMARKASLEIARLKDKFVEAQGALRERAVSATSPKEAALQAEARAFIRSLPDHGARLRHLLDGNPALVRAVLDAPSELSGSIPVESLHALEANFMSRHYSAESAALADHAAGLEVAEASLALAQNAVRSAANVDPKSYAEWSESIAPK
jgi:hypothetical protein